MSLVTPRLEFSPDPLSDTTPTWTDITDDCTEIEWWSGKTNDLDDPEPGGMTCRLNNPGRKFEPEFPGDFVNMVENPSFELNNATNVDVSGVSLFFGTGGTQIVGSVYLIVNATGTAVGNAFHRNMDGSKIQAAAGEVWTVSLYARQDVGTRQLAIGVDQYDAGGGGTSTQVQAFALTSSWVRYEATFTLSALTAGVRIITRMATTGAIGDRIDIDGIQFERAPAATPYVDGSLPNNRWTGAAHASTSWRYGAFYPNIDTERRFRLLFDTDGPQGIEFWGDFEFGADGTALEWTSMNGFLECKAGSEARQLQYVSSPTPRLGARIGRFEVAAGDQFGATTGERCEVRRGTPNGGFGTGDLEGETVYYQFSTRWLAPWTHPSGEGIFWQMHDSGSTWGQPPFRWRLESGIYTFRAVTGLFPNSTDAGTGSNPGTNGAHQGRAFLADQWWDFRHAIYYTTGTDGWYIAQMKKDSESTWTDVANVAGVRTLPSYPGSGATSMFDKQGWYRPASAFTNVVFQDGYQVGHSWSDVGYPTSTPGPEWNQITWDNAANSSDNPDFEVDIVGTAAAGGGVTTRTWDTTRAKFGSGSLKAVTNGAASGQGVFHTQRSLSRFTATAGKTYTASAWMSGDGFEEIRIGIEWFDGGGASISTTFATPKALRTDFRHHYLTAVAPVNSVTARVRTSYLSTTAGTFWVDGVGFWEGTYGITYAEGLWYAESWELEYPGMTATSQVVVTAVDGFGILSNDTLDLLDPPDATSYPDVVSYSQPGFQYRLGEPEGTKMVSHVRTVKRRGYTAHGGQPAIYSSKKRWKTKATRAEVEGVAGPAGTYKNTPTLGVPGAILGDPDTAVLFTRSQSEYARISLDADISETIAGNRLTVEAWIKLTANTANTNIIVDGPLDGGGASVWDLFTGFGSDKAAFQVVDNTGGTRTLSGATTLTAGTWYYVVGTWNENEIAIWVNGIKENSAGTGGTSIKNPAASSRLIIGGSESVNWFDGAIDEVAIYEKVLEPTTILSHYTAGTARGFPEQLTGARIAAIASSPLWSTAGIDAGVFVMQPTMEFGQGKLDEIVEASNAERPRSLFFFNGYGDPIYRDFDYLDGQANDLTLGDATGELSYMGVEPIYDNEVYNTVTGSTDGGTAITATDAQSISDRRPKTRDAETSLPLRDDSDVLTIVSTIATEWAKPAQRFASITTLGKDAEHVTHILGREIGDRVRVKRRGEGGTPIDRQTVILGYRKRMDRNRILSCTWNLARGFNAAGGGWHLGVLGYTELDSTAVLN